MAEQNTEHWIKPDALHHWVMQLWLAAGSRELEARLTADHLVQANLSGHDSHGVGMIPAYVDSWMHGGLQLNQTVQIASDMGAMLTLDGQDGMGQVMAFQAMELAIERARIHGSCVMGLRNSHHLGRVGHWAEQAMASGMVAIHFTSARSKPVVAPHGGSEGRFVTNPFTVGLPRKNAPNLLLDFATSAIAAGKVRVAYNKQIDAPADCLIDHNGVPTLNPAALFDDPKGALLTFAGHKGYALAVMCELLSAALLGATTTRAETITSNFAVWNNMLTVVFDPSKMGDLLQFESEAARFESWVKSTRLAPGSDKIRMPGDTENESRLQRANGIPIDHGTVTLMNQAAALVSSRSIADLRMKNQSKLPDLPTEIRSPT